MAWTSPKTFTANSVLTASELNTHLRDNLKAATEWTAYTPTWSGTGGTPSVGNGSLTGRYIIAGNVCHLRIDLAWGSTTTANSATNWVFSLPSGASPATMRGLLMWVANDYGTRVYSGISQWEVGSTTTPWLFRDDSAAGVAATVPFTWTTSDTLTLSATYEI